MKLRWYQDEAINAVYNFLATQEGHPIIALPTGTGKSFVIAEFVRLVMTHFPTQRILNLTHVKELIVQNMEELLGIWKTAPIGVYSASVGRKEHSRPITFAGIGTIHNRAELFGHIDLVIIDECHLVSDRQKTMYRKFITKLMKINPNIRIIGLTATYYRLGLGDLTNGGLFTDVAYDMTSLDSFNRLVAEGFLVPLIPKRTKLQFDMSEVRTQSGEFVQSEMQAAYDVDELTLAAVREIIAEAQGRNKCLIFAAGIQHAEHVAGTINSLMNCGYASADYIHSRMPDEVRDTRLAAFKAGRFKFLVNNTILTTGYNDPSLDMIAILFSTKSPVKWVQVLGRLTRPFPGKVNGLVLDFGGNTARLGPINDPVLPAKKGKGGGTAPVRLCPHCDTYNHASVRHCIQCGFEFPKDFKFKAVASTVEVMKDDAPVVEDFEVDRITYTKHTKRGGTPTLQVTYYCGLRMFREWVCLEHTSNIRHRAHKWWKARSTAVPPINVDLALLYVHQMREPTRIKVWMNAKYPEILNHEF